MGASGSWRRYRRRRMIGGLIAAAVVLLLLVLVVAVSCSREDGSSGNGSVGSTGAEQGSGGNAGGGNGSGEQSGQNGRGGNGSGGENTGEQEEIPQPFAAIEPSADATPLSENVPAEYESEVLRYEDSVASAAQGQYAEEATGGQRGPQRSAPLGGVLPEGEEDPSDGPLKDNRIVAYYGTPLSNQMGILGESGPEQVMRQLKDQTAAYSEADPDRPAVPAIEFIASIAQRDPGAEGMYVAQTDPAEIETYAKLAEENDALLILDVQLGGMTVMDEVRILEDFLKRPYVHLAIDTEYSIDPGQVPGLDLGSVDGAEIQEAIDYLDGMVESEGIPDKMVMIHEFQQNIVTNKQSIEPTSNVQVALHADGFGNPGDKFAKYGLLVREEPIQYGGFKVFYNQDTPVLEPQQVLAMDPAPAIVTYQ